MLEDSRAGSGADKLKLVPREFVRSPEAMARTWTPAESLAYTRWLARHHYENFHVASFLLPRRLHQDFFNVYAFCRWADDLGDEIGDTQESLRLLGWWREELKAMYGGRTRHPVFVALAETARRHELPPEPFDDLIRAIGRSCYVVDDDFMIGMRWILEDVPLDGDPLASLAEAYLERSSYSPVQHARRKPKETMLLQRIERSRARAAIVTAAKMCEPGLEEQVAYTHALDQANIPYFVSEFEENMTSYEQLAIQLETFVENLMFD